MKPITLIMSAFGPYRNMVTIPFQTIGPKGLFLIHGDTGAGKTTIFDAISFALFGNASGENRTTDTFRSDFAGTEDKTYVELIFQHRSQEYHIVRNPMYLRKKRVGTGMTEEKANATLTMPDGRVISGYSSVTDAITTLLGIDWKQFKQISMIAQGEFLQLLTANSVERGVIFRKVFGTHIFDDVQKKLRTMANRLKNECDDIDKSILQFLSGIQCDTGSVSFEAIEEWKKTKDIHQLPKIMGLLEGLIEVDDNNYKKTKQENELLSAKIKEKTTEYTTAEQVNKLLILLQQAREEYQNLLKKEKEMKEKEEERKRSEKALFVIKPMEEVFLRLQIEVHGLEKTIEEAKENICKLEKDYQRLDEELKEKENDKSKINDLTKEINRLSEEIEKHDSYTECSQRKKKLVHTKDQMELEFVDLLSSKLEQKEELQQKQEELERYRGVEKECLLCEKQLETYKNLLQQLEEVLEEIETNRKKKDKLQQLQEDYKKAENAYNAQNAKFVEMETCFLREQAGIIAATLEEGEPCPVCGSKEHPVKANVTQGAPREEEIKQEKLKLDSAWKALNELSTSCHQQSAQIEMMQVNIQKRATAILKDETFNEGNLMTLMMDGLEEVKSLVSQEKEKEQILNTQLQRKDFLEKQIEDITKRLQQVGEKIEKDQETLSNVKSEISSVNSALDTLQKDLKYPSKAEAEQSLTNQKDQCKKMQDAITLVEAALRKCEFHLGSTKAVLQDNEKNYEGKRKSLWEAEEAYKAKRVAVGFDTEEAYKMALRTEEELVAMGQTIGEYYKRMEYLEQRVGQLKTETLNKTFKDLEIIEKDLRLLEEDKVKCEEGLQKIFSRLTNNKEIYKKVNKKYKEQETKRKEFTTVSELSKTANGDLAGKRKVAFEQFVQAFYFNHIINEANKRFYIMSSHQYALKRKEESGNLRSLSGLELEVMDYYTGKCRSIKSLSGGESFKAALSLALGLSDVIQSFAGGIEVDAMFIDEGFGSLDSNSLEQAIDTLNTLTSGDRLVGIISHVNELQERIDKKIVINKTMEGSNITIST